MYEWAIRLAIVDLEPVVGYTIKLKLALIEQFLLGSYDMANVDI